MSDAETYLRELRRSLPLGYRRRFVTEMREHFESAVAAEAERGVGRPEAERLTIERLGPARALAEQLIADLRSGALGRGARFAVGLTTTRVIALAAVLAIAIVSGVVLLGRGSHPAPPASQPAVASPRLVLLPSGEQSVHAIIYRLHTTIQARYKPTWHTRDGESFVLHEVYVR